MINMMPSVWDVHFHGLVQDCSNSIALAMELLQCCIKPSIYELNIQYIPGIMHTIHALLCFVGISSYGF